MTIETIKSSGEHDAREDSSNPLEDLPSFEEYMAQIESDSNSEIPKEINQRSFYESDNIPQNTNGDLILDPKASLLPNEGPYSQIIENEIITTPKDVAFLSSSEKIKLSNNHELSSELLKRCLSVDAYYYSATKHMHEDNPLGNVLRASLLVYMSDEDIKRGMADIYSVESINSKSDLVRGLIALEESGQLGELSDTEKERLDEFKELTSTRAFAEKMHGATYETEVDGKNVTLPVDNIITFLNLSPDDLKKICTTDPDGKIGQLSKPEFAYAASEYLKKNKVTENYVLPDNIEKRIGFLTSGQYIDFSAVNKLMETKDTLYEKVELNPDLHDAIIEKMPEGISRLEKAAYIYAKMCTILTYDNRFMAANQKGEAAEKHKSLDYVSQISPENNEVVCFEFNMIYAKMLDEQGLHFKSEYKDMIGEDYGDGHANLEFRDGKFIVQADSVASILGGDIARAKLGLPLTGFECESPNKRTQKEFQDKVNAMYELVQSQERENDPWNEYDSLTENLYPVEFDEKKAILLDRLKSTNLRGIDAMTYALQLRKALFSEQERRDNISVVVLRNNAVNGEGPKLEAGAVIAMNGSNLDDQPSETSYYYLSSNKELSSITLEDVKSRLNDGTFEYIERNDPKIPGTVEMAEEKGE
jgi:hypothetical protein